MSRKEVTTCDQCKKPYEHEYVRVTVPGWDYAGTREFDLCSQKCLIAWAKASDE